MLQLRHRRPESGGVDTGIGTVTGTAGAAAEWSGAIWVYFGLQVCFSKIPTRRGPGKSLATKQSQPYRLRSFRT